MKKLLLAMCLMSSAALAEDKTFLTPKDDPALAQAMTEAQATLLTFLQHVTDTRGIGREGAALKVGFATKDAEHPVEYIWMSPFIFLPDGKVAGLALNAGQYATEVQANKTSTFEKTQIVDWGWRPGDGKAWGEYTTRAIFAAEKADAKALLGVPFSDTPLPPDWR